MNVEEKTVGKKGLMRTERDKIILKDENDQTTFYTWMKILQ